MVARLGSLLLLILLSSVTQVSRSQSSAARALITDRIDSSVLVQLRGNTRSEARPSNDRGAVADDLKLAHMQLLLRRPMEREVDLQRYIEQLHDRASPNFHRWVSATQFGQRFGLAASDIATITGWLRAQGFTVNIVHPSTMTIDFSGTAAQVRDAFHTEIHYLDVHGARHIANMSDPKVPGALAEAIAGIVSLHDFRPHTNFVARSKFSFSANGVNDLAIAPADLATIYNLNPLFSSGVSGQNQSIAVIENTNVSSTADWSAFPSIFGLSSFTSGSFAQIHPAPGSGGNNCTNPGVISGNETEAELDSEWASAAAPSAAILLASCQDTSTTFGGLIAIQNLVNGSSPPPIISLSYGLCEAENGATANAAFSSIYQQAVALGISVFVSTGDEGAAGCDPRQSAATHGIAVNGFASTAYNVAVGGTDFSDTFAGTTSTYWNASNSGSFGSALSYIPEIPWNDSCAGSLVATFSGFSAGFGSNGFCNSAGGADFLTTAAASGGPSGCASGAPSTTGVVNGTCKGTPKPSWQRAPGNPSDGVRDLPDVALFASNGVWKHFYIFCDSDTSDGGAACTGSPSTWSRAGGTSFSTPILAGIQALVNQSTGARQGNPNPVYYALATSQFASSLQCNSSSGNAVASGCVFYDVRQGDMNVNCQGMNNCFDPSGTNGALSTSNGSFGSAYAAGVGWDFATGLGSINASNLVKLWNSSDLSLLGGSSFEAGFDNFSLSLSNAGPQAAAATTITTTLPAGASLLTSSSSSACAQSGQTVTCTIGTLAKGATALVSVNIQTSVPSLNLSFSAASSNGDINPANDTLALVAQANNPATDGPLPLWTYVVLGVTFLGIARRRVPTL